MMTDEQDKGMAGGGLTFKVATGTLDAAMTEALNDYEDADEEGEAQLAAYNEEQAAYRAARQAEIEKSLESLQVKPREAEPEMSPLMSRRMRRYLS